MYIFNFEEVFWLKECIEGFGKEIIFIQNGCKVILNKLVEVEGFEKFLYVKYMGIKCFGFDGGEVLIFVMEQIIKCGGVFGVKDIVIGMLYCGCLNILVNVMGKLYCVIFNEFQGGLFKFEDVDGLGDVKYYFGVLLDCEFDGNIVYLLLIVNLLYLEVVNFVVLGKVCVKVDQMGDSECISVLLILLYGDVVFVGQGVVVECFGLFGLCGYCIGGMIYIVVNNQIGFIIVLYFLCSLLYLIDIVLMVEVLIFYVNGDDFEVVVYVVKVVIEFCQKFKKDVVIDIFCYCCFGYNEGDELMFINLVMYINIKCYKMMLILYIECLVKDGLILEGEIEDMKVLF